MTKMSCWSSNYTSTPSNHSIGIYQALERFNAVYKDAHSYLSIFVCLCGIILNAANVVVLTRPAMSTNPINAILTIIALSDACVMVSYVPYAVWRSSDVDYCELHWQTYAWAFFVLFNSCLTVICHAVSIWLTVAMALIRAITVRRKSFAKIWTTRNSYILSFVIFTLALIMYVPGMVSYRVASRRFDVDFCRNATGEEYDEISTPKYIYITAVSEIGYANQCLLLKSAFWINGVMFKMVPCILLSVFIGVLLHILTEVKQRKNRLRSGSNGGLPSNGQSSGRRSSQDRTTDRTTLMLVVLLAVFLAAELPQGLLLISTGLASSEFRTRVFMNLGALTDLLSLLNSAVNFVIYCAMSQKFREIFCQTILPPSLRYGYFCDVDTSMHLTTNGATRIRYRGRSFGLFRGSAANTTREISLAAYSSLQQTDPTAYVDVNTKRRRESEASTRLLKTPTASMEKLAEFVRKQSILNNQRPFASLPGAVVNSHAQDDTDSMAIDDQAIPLAPFDAALKFRSLFARYVGFKLLQLAGDRCDYFLDMFQRRPPLDGLYWTYEPLVFQD